MFDEGYIKYHAILEPGPVPHHALLNDLNACRSRLHDLGLVGQRSDGIGFGNVSIRSKDSQFIISGSATGHWRELSTEQYVLVKDCDFKKNTVYAQGAVQASSESMSHAAVYQSQAQAHVVFHIHSRQLFDFLLELNWPYTPKECAFGTPEIAYAIARLVVTLPSSAVFVCAGHDEGIMAYGPDPLTVLETIENLKYQGLKR